MNRMKNLDAGRRTADARCRDHGRRSTATSSMTATAAIWLVSLAVAGLAAATPADAVTIFSDRADFTSAARAFNQNFGNRADVDFNDLSSAPRGFTAGALKFDDWVKVERGNANGLYGAVDATTYAQFQLASPFYSARDKKQGTIKSDHAFQFLGFSLRTYFEQRSAPISDQGKLIRFTTDRGETVDYVLPDPSKVAFLGFAFQQETRSITVSTLYDRHDGAWFGADDFQFWSPTLPASVPEPATWAMMIGGFGLVGIAMRRRRSIVTFA